MRFISNFNIGRGWIGTFWLPNNERKGNDIGGVSYDKAALGTLIGLRRLVTVFLKVLITVVAAKTTAIAIGAILGGASGLYLDNKEKIT